MFALTVLDVYGKIAGSSDSFPYPCLRDISHTRHSARVLCYKLVSASIGVDVCFSRVLQLFIFALDLQKNPVLLGEIVPVSETSELDW